MLAVLQDGITTGIASGAVDEYRRIAAKTDERSFEAVVAIGAVAGFEIAGVQRGGDDVAGLRVGEPVFSGWSAA